MHYGYRQSRNDIVNNELGLVAPDPIEDRNVCKYKVYPCLFGHGRKERALNGFWGYQLPPPVFPHRALDWMETSLKLRFIQQTPADPYVFIPAR